MDSPKRAVANITAGSRQPPVPRFFTGGGYVAAVSRCSIVCSNLYGTVGAAFLHGPSMWRLSVEVWCLCSMWLRALVPYGVRRPPAWPAPKLGNVGFQSLWERVCRQVHKRAGCVLRPLQTTPQLPFFAGVTHCGCVFACRDGERLASYERQREPWIGGRHGGCPWPNRWRQLTKRHGSSVQANVADGGS